jgi:16S rRNA (cytosine967-C5)-methyltransferase
MKVRAEAAQILEAVIFQGKSLAAFTETIKAHDESPLLQMLCYGSLRHYELLAFVIGELATKKVKPKIAYALLIVGIFQLYYLDKPAYAVINETVGACKPLKLFKLKGFINGVLRNADREKARLLQKSDSQLEAKYCHPKWMIDRIQADWPDHWESILKANNTQAPMWLRVNTTKTTPEAYLKRLDVPATQDSVINVAIRLHEPMPVSALPGFAEGEVSVQSLSAQYAAHFLDVKPGMRVLDACAAPGGKTCHILEHTPDIDLWALDKDPERLAQVDENLKRLGLKAKTLCADASEPDTWWDGEPFDRILLDAPCSAMGVINRHPDIKRLRQVGDIEALQQTQSHLLQTLWSCLKPGGELLYSTCSVLSQENEAVVTSFLKGDMSSAGALEIASPQAVLGPALGLQFLPTDEADGFYYHKMLFKKSAK